MTEEYLYAFGSDQGHKQTLADLLNFLKSWKKLGIELLCDYREALITILIFSDRHFPPSDVSPEDQFKE
jgi:hypothetical protein